MKKIAVDNQILGEVIIETLNRRQKAAFMVKGRSMMPFFKDGKTIVSLDKKKHYNKNDVIFFRYKGHLKLHRIINIKNDDIIACGDYLFQKEHIKHDDIIGYVESFQTKDNIIDTNQFTYRLSVQLWKIVKPVIRIFLR